MIDIIDKATRSRMMSGIRGKNTKPELIIRSGLHRRGFRFRLHSSGLPGKPDIALPKYKALILVHGCFWHGHDCHLFKWPNSRTSFWRKKIGDTKKRDENNLLTYQKAGWRILTIWECALKGKDKATIDNVLDTCTEWLQTGAGINPMSIP